MGLYLRGWECHVDSRCSATGLLGSEVCRRLAGRGRECRALVRETSDAQKKKALKESGATLVTGDLKDRDSLMAACKGAKAIISTASATISQQPSDSIEAVDLKGQLNLVAAAKANDWHGELYS